MNRPHSLAVIITLGMAALVLGGCGENTGSPSGVYAAGGKIAEYVGDGHDGTKPPPPFLSLAPAQLEQVQTQAMATQLNNAAHRVASTVPVQQANWFSLPAATSACTWIVTLQQLAGEDGDLFLLKSNQLYASGAPLLASSTRLPDSGQVDVVDGNVPDWVAYTVPGQTSGYPVGYPVVYGAMGGAALKHFNIEADTVPQLLINGAGKAGTLALRDSNWFWFNGLNGVPYSVRMTAMSGDPDIYVYGDTSSKFRDKNTASGSGTVVFTANATQRHYIRLHAFTAGKYSIKVTSP